MIRFAKSFLSFGLLACAAALLIVSFPKAAHAVAAALVQITNTTANPAVTQDVSKRAGEIVELNCDQQFYQTQYCYPLVGDSPYVVPAGKSLVITTVDVYVPAQDRIFLQTTVYPPVYPPGPGSPETNVGFYAYISGQLHYNYQSGIVVSSGSAVQLFGAITTTNIGHLYGYLTSN
jgi:hypothetical protein